MSRRELYADAGTRLAEWIIRCGGDEKAIDLLCAYVADPEGGSLSDFCQEEGLMWSMLATWIKKDDKRNALYKQGLDNRGAIRRERLLDGWWKTVQIKVADSQATHRDIHQAREALAKAEGMPGFSNAPAVNVNGDGVTVQIVRFAGDEPAAQPVQPA